MQNLTTEQQHYALERFAQFARPVQVQKEIKAEWNLDVSLQALQVYNPATVAGRRMSAEHKAHFAQARTAFEESRDYIGLCNPLYRRMRLQEIIDDAQFGQNPYLVKDIVELCEKLDGGLFKQRQNGVPVADVNTHIAELTSDVRETIARAIPDETLRDHVLTAVNDKLASRGPQGGG